MPTGSRERLPGNAHQVMISQSGQHQEADAQYFLCLLSWRCQGNQQESPFRSRPSFTTSPVGCNGNPLVTSGPSMLLFISSLFTPDPPQGASGPASSPTGVCSHWGLLQGPVSPLLPPWPVPPPGPGCCCRVLDTHTASHACQPLVWWGSPCYPQLTAPALSLPSCGSILTPSAGTPTARGCSWTGCSLSGPDFHTSPLLLPLRLPQPSKYYFS